MALAALALLTILIGGATPRVPLRAIARRVHINQGGVRANNVLLWLFGMQYNSDFSVREGDFDTWLHRTASIVPETIKWSDFNGRECPSEMQIWARDLSDDNVTHVNIRGKGHGKDEVTGGIHQPTAPHGWLVWVMARESIENELVSELPLQLQIDQESVFNEFDRIRAESELRAAIILPLTILIAILVSQTAFWALAFALPLWLLRQAVQSHVEADQKLRGAVRHGAIPSTTIEFMKFLGGPKVV